MAKTALVVQHVAFEDLGFFEPVLEEAGYEIVYREMGLDGLDAAEAARAELLIVLGGPIGVYEEEKYPWLGGEVAAIQARLKEQKPTLGVCLGAQLMARALGARVYPGPVKEIGFQPLTLSEAGRASCLAVFEGQPVLHWHGDTFDLPEGAVLLASTPGCRQQAFSLGPNAIGFQFHPEAGAAGFERWLIGHTAELAASGKSVPALRGDYERLKGSLAGPAEQCLGLWLGQLR